MYVALDVHYGEESAAAACVAFRDPASDAVEGERTSLIAERPAIYEPGRFYLRELPYLVPLVREARARWSDLVAIIDGYVWLAAEGPGLGHELHATFQGLPVIGVAKKSFHGAPAVSVLRGRSQRPLFVTAVGLAAADAADLVRSMHGTARVPTLLKRADRLARDALVR